MYDFFICIISLYIFNFLICLIFLYVRFRCVQKCESKDHQRNYNLTLLDLDFVRLKIFHYSKDKFIEFFLDNKKKD